MEYTDRMVRRSAMPTGPGQLRVVLEMIEFGTE